jgi:hypothetical protein
MLESIASLFKTNQGPKVFCVGRNKTGTKSLSKALSDLGYKVAPQKPAAVLIEDWAQRDFRSLVRFCKSAGQVFQDHPFSFPYTFQAMDENFPGSKFILTVRDTPENWYNSLVRFHGKHFANGGIPTKEDLMNAEYGYKGLMWKINKLVYDIPDNDIYNKEILIQHYLRHNETVLDYFKHRPQDLLVLNVGEKDAYKKLCNFLNIKTVHNDFPWENRNS